MKNPTLIFALLTALVLAACATPLPQQDLSVTYTTYGGFTMPQQALSIITIDDRDVTIDYAYPNGTVTSSIGYTASREAIAALRAAIRASDFPDLPSIVEAPEPIPVADVGSSNLTIELGPERSNTVIELNWQDSMPDDVARIIDAIYAVTMEAPQPEYEGQRAFEPMQCEQTPWEEWYAEGNIQYLVEPTAEQLITDYYAQEHDIEIRSVEQRTREGAVCEACGVCPQSTYYVAWIAGDDIEALEALGWGPVPSEVSSGADLEGEWNLAGGSIEGETVDFEASLTVESDRIGGSAPCNGYGADATFEDSDVTLGPIVSTMMYCEGLMDDESVYLSALDAIESYALGTDTLTLTGENVELIYERDEHVRTSAYFIETPCEENPEWYPEVGSNDVASVEAYLARLGIDADVTYTSRGAVCKACLDDCAASYVSATVDASEIDMLVSEGWLDEHPFPDEPVTSQ